jgi:hypothetical protein
LDGNGRLVSLILGTEHNDKLVFAGRVYPEIGDWARVALEQSLSAIQVKQPFVPMQSAMAKWVQPKYACRVTFSERTNDGQLRDVKWDTLLGAIPAR